MESSKDEDVLAACKLFKQFRFIDDILLALDNQNQAITLNKVIDKIFNGMGMKVAKYVTNSPKLLETTPKEEKPNKMHRAPIQ